MYFSFPQIILFKKNPADISLKKLNFCFRKTLRRKQKMHIPRNAVSIQVWFVEGQICFSPHIKFSLLFDISRLSQFSFVFGVRGEVFSLWSKYLFLSEDMRITQSNSCSCHLLKGEPRHHINSFWRLHRQAALQVSGCWAQARLTQMEFATFKYEKPVWKRGLYFLSEIL